MSQSSWWGKLAGAISVSLGAPLHRTVGCYPCHIFVNGYTILMLLEGNASLRQRTGLGQVSFPAPSSELCQPDDLRQSWAEQRL